MTARVHLIKHSWGRSYLAGTQGFILETHPEVIADAHTLASKYGVWLFSYYFSLCLIGTDT